MYKFPGVCPVYAGIKSRDPFAAPAINTNYFTDKEVRAGD